jgi:hypothetical protein
LEEYLSSLLHAASSARAKHNPETELHENSQIAGGKDKAKEWLGKIAAASANNEEDREVKKEAAAMLAKL